MVHLFAQHENIHDTYIEITGHDVNHLKNVLRCREGDKLLVSSGDNTDYNCRISSLGDTLIRAEIESSGIRGKELQAKVYLFQGLPKGDKMELVVQKMTELGVYSIIPVAMRRSVVKLTDKKAEARTARWQAVAEAAAKQSRRSVIPQVTKVMDFQEALAYAKECCKARLLPYECADGMQKTRRIIESLAPDESVAIFIGPEGGFELEELAQAQAAGFDVITLGRRILRTETAGMMLMSVLMYHFEE